ncbi:hypothetical protein FC47_GL001150 [Limosilactobacillus mucosae DSM 13345]|uniref:Uncharacterized protein n=1 Tax=Limosilactobacillus mucosae DSM 13345 TaxID=1423771 RepID=A0A0R1NVW9_LIMMU|nr:hypothetical protein FC47_GL001150 [Limosilactobacillus mucosae DSM 13345]
MNQGNQANDSYYLPKTKRRWKICSQQRYSETANNKDSRFTDFNFFHNQISQYNQRQSKSMILTIIKIMLLLSF